MYVILGARVVIHDMVKPDQICEYIHSSHIQFFGMMHRPEACRAYRVTIPQWRIQDGKFGVNAPIEHYIKVATH